MEEYLRRVQSRVAVSREPSAAANPGMNEIQTLMLQAAVLLLEKKGKKSAGVEKRASHASLVAPPSTCRSPTERQERRLFQCSKHAVFNECVHLNEELLSNERRA